MRVDQSGCKNSLGDNMSDSVDRQDTMNYGSSSRKAAGVNWALSALIGKVNAGWPSA